MTALLTAQDVADELTSSDALKELAELIELVRRVGPPIEWPHMCCSDARGDRTITADGCPHVIAVCERHWLAFLRLPTRPAVHVAPPNEGCRGVWRRVP